MKYGPHVVTDVVHDGKPVIGYGFNSNGRYGQGALMRERSILRVLEASTAAPDSMRDLERDNLDPHRVWAAMMANEKPGGHGERSVAVGTVDMAVWDAVAKIEREPLHHPLAERYGRGQSAEPRVFVYAAGDYYWPGQGIEGLTREIQGYLDRGYSVVKKKIGGAALAEDCQRIEAVLRLLGSGQRLAVDANGRFDLKTAVACAKALAQYDLFWYEEADDPLDYALQAELAQHYDKPMATGENLFSMQRAQLDPLWRHAARPRLAAIRLRAQLRPGGVRAHAGHVESYPDLFQPYGGFPDGVRVENGYVTLPELPGIGFEGKADLHAQMMALAG